MSLIFISEYNQTYQTYRFVICVYILLCVILPHNCKPYRSLEMNKLSATFLRPFWFSEFFSLLTIKSLRFKEESLPKICEDHLRLSFEVLILSVRRCDKYLYMLTL